MQNTITANKSGDGVGDLLREWRQRRRISQLHLALEAGISQRHLSFVESGRAAPSREMVLNLAETLAVPLRERNRLLLAAGYAPSFAERSLGDPVLKPAMEAVQLLLDGHAPNPALAIDRYWTMLLANGAVAPLLAEIQDKSLLEPPVNALRLSLHPKGLAPNILNLTEWRAHVLVRLRDLNDLVADPVLADLEKELASYPGGPSSHRPKVNHSGSIAVPFQMRLGGAELSFITTTTVFGAPLDITLSELAIEGFFPANQATARFLREAQADVRIG
ncbi:helix-turn-helix domain-containing protein [Chelativorans alearense]|uniref:helix-turn-helix domain-containing protein n=1 Tax=Chelativorans alearense TaxID=2681495 RepID=UPI0013D61281|nr:helix-turn-helix transcriptional regulator [Chelativorans alearense]